MLKGMSLLEHYYYGDLLLSCCYTYNVKGETVWHGRGSNPGYFAELANTQQLSSKPPDQIADNVSP